MQVYVIVGFGILRKYGEIEWDEIERRLNVLRDLSIYFDFIIKVVVYVKIIGEGNQVLFGVVFVGNII